MQTQINPQPPFWHVLALTLTKLDFLVEEAWLQFEIQMLIMLDTRKSYREMILCDDILSKVQNERSKL